MNSKKGVSPIIATLLLIALVIIIAVIVFTWFKGLQKEAITKFGGTNIELVCEDVKFDASYSGGLLTVSNFGNVPIYNLDARIDYPGGHETQTILETGFAWPETGLNQGGVVSGGITLPANTNKITLIPILLGVDKEGNRKTAPCKERHGEEIFI